MLPIQYKTYFNTQAVGISFLRAGEIFLHTSPLLDSLPQEQGVKIINSVLKDFFALRNAPNRPESRFIEIGNHQQAFWRTGLFGPFHLLSPHHPPREVILPVLNIGLAIEE